MRIMGYGLLFVLTAALAGCGSSSASSTAAPTTTSPTAKHTGAVLVTTAKVSVHGKRTTVLVTRQGRTLYYFTKDHGATSACTGSCTSLWSPLLATHGSVKAGTGITGKLAVVKDGNGRQVSYDGHLLYRYSGDTKAGEAKGEGLLKEWWVATPSLGAQSGGTSGSGGW